MNRYIALTKGESVEHSDSDEEDAGDNSLYIDKQGVKIERSGGKVEIVKSSDSISSIKNRFGTNSSWKRADSNDGGAPGEEVDANKVSSARNVFMVKDEKVEKSFSRPSSKKIRDPKELMEIRKRATYGDEEELPQDGVVTKTVEIGKEELDTACKNNALNMYKSLERKEDINVELQKPKTKLLSDGEVQATMEGIRSISSNTSETSESANDLTVDTVSGYGSAAPCSPSSTLSEDYLSDHKDASPRSDLKGDFLFFISYRLQSVAYFKSKR